MAGIIAQVRTPYCGVTCLPAYYAFLSDTAGSHKVRKHEMFSHTCWKTSETLSIEKTPSQRLSFSVVFIITKSKSQSDSGKGVFHIACSWHMTFKDSVTCLLIYWKFMVQYARWVLKGQLHYELEECKKNAECSWMCFTTAFWFYSHLYPYASFLSFIFIWPYDITILVHCVK